VIVVPTVIVCPPAAGVSVRRASGLDIASRLD